jgi:hypothetical protein
MSTEWNPFSSSFYTQKECTNARGKSGCFWFTLLQQTNLPYQLFRIRRLNNRKPWVGLAIQRATRISCSRKRELDFYG